MHNAFPKSVCSTPCWQICVLNQLFYHSRALFTAALLTPVGLNIFLVLRIVTVRLQNCRNQVVGPLAAVGEQERFSTATNHSLP